MHGTGIFDLSLTLSLIKRIKTGFLTLFYKKLKIRYDLSASLYLMKWTVEK